MKTHRSDLQPLLRLNASDKEKYAKLSEQRYAKPDLTDLTVQQNANIV